MRWLLAGLVVLVLAGCGESRYDTNVRTCEMTDGRFQIEVRMNRDTAYGTTDPVPKAMAEAFQAACGWVGSSP